MMEMDSTKLQCVSNQEYKDPETMLGMSILFGWLGIDRFMLGQAGLGILKLLTLGGFGVWWFADWFLITSATKEYNFKKAINCSGQFQGQTAG
jgi:TM2 domain-containing membrane protein YozV